MITKLDLHETAKTLRLNAGYSTEIVKALEASKDVLKPFDGKVYNCKLQKALNAAELTVGGRTVWWRINYSFMHEGEQIEIELEADRSLPYMSDWTRTEKLYNVPLKFVGSTYRFDFAEYSANVDKRIDSIKQNIQKIEAALRDNQFAKDMQEMARLENEYAPLYGRMHSIVRDKFRSYFPTSNSTVEITDDLDFAKAENDNLVDKLLTRRFGEEWERPQKIREEMARIIKNDPVLSKRNLDNPETDDMAVFYMTMKDEPLDEYWGTMVEAFQRICDSLLEYNEYDNEYTCNGGFVFTHVFLGYKKEAKDFIKEMQEALA